MDNPILISGVEKLATLGEQAGFTVEEMIRILKCGFSVEELLEVILVRLEKQQKESFLRHFG